MLDCNWLLVFTNSINSIIVFFELGQLLKRRRSLESAVTRMMLIQISII